MVRKLYEDYSGEWQHKVKVPRAWVEKTASAVRFMELQYGKHIRVMHVGGAVAVAFKRGAEIVVPCPHGASEAYHVALEQALKS